MQDFPRPPLFVSYSHKDARLKDEVLSHLMVLRNQRLIDLWEDSRIGGGVDWLGEIRAALDAAKVAVLLVSPHFLSSEFILSEEVPTLLRRRSTEGLRVIPVLIRDCDWEAVEWLRVMQLRPKDARPLASFTRAARDRYLAALAKEIRTAVERPALGGGDVDTSPAAPKAPEQDMRPAGAELVSRIEREPGVVMLDGVHPSGSLPAIMWRLRVSNIAGGTMAVGVTPRITASTPAVGGLPITLHKMHDDVRPYHLSWDIRANEELLFDVVAMVPASDFEVLLFQSDRGDLPYIRRLSGKEQREIGQRLWQDGFLFRVEVFANPPARVPEPQWYRAYMGGEGTMDFRLLPASEPSRSL